MTLEQLAELLHMFFCVKFHEEDMLQLKMKGHDDAGCLWYLEDCLENKWEKEAHKEWLENARLFVSIVEERMPGKVLTYVGYLRELIRNYEELREVGLQELVDLLFLKNTLS